MGLPMKINRSLCLTTRLSLAGFSPAAGVCPAAPAPPEISKAVRGGQGVVKVKTLHLDRVIHNQSRLLTPPGQGGQGETQHIAHARAWGDPKQNFDFIEKTLDHPDQNSNGGRSRLDQAP